MTKKESSPPPPDVARPPPPPRPPDISASASNDLLGCRIGKEGRYTKIGDDMTWPSFDQGECEWRMRYANEETVLRERMIIASIVASYRELIDMPQKKRNAICRALKEAT